LGRKKKKQQKMIDVFRPEASTTNNHRPRALAGR
jgi:hypothetical protein